VKYIYFHQNEWRHFWHSFQIREKASLRVPVEPNSDLSRLIPCGVTVTYLPSLEVASLSINNPVSNVLPRKIHVRSEQVFMALLPGNLFSFGKFSSVWRHWFILFLWFIYYFCEYLVTVEFIVLWNWIIVALLVLYAKEICCRWFNSHRFGD